MIEDRTKKIKYSIIYDRRNLGIEKHFNLRRIILYKHTVTQT